jgi:CBS domain-containing protein
MRAAVPEGEREREAEALKQPVSSILKRDFPTVSPDGELRNVARTMVTLRIEALPVVETHSRRLRGMVSYVDLLRAAIDRL